MSENSLYLDVDAVAAAAGVKPATIHTYRKRGTIPPADHYFGRSPVWSQDTIAEWVRGRSREDALSPEEI